LSRRGGTRIRAERKPIIVLAGESGNERMIMRILLEACCPQAKGRIVEVNDGIRLREAGDEKLAARVQQLARSVRARAAREQASVACVFIHEDLDDVDSEKCIKIHARVQQALEHELGHSHYVLATWEVEAWLLLFPEALADFADSWSVPAKYQGADTGMIHDPKRVLRQQVSKAGPKYRESDAPGITERAVALGLHMKPTGTNRSYSRFRADVGTCCQAL
jgi:hypothetical protein